MKEVFKAFEELNATNSNKDKIAILKKYTSSKKLKTLLKINLDPNRNFYITKWPAKKFFTDSPVVISSDLAYKELVNLSEDLEHRIFTGDSARKVLAKKFETFDGTTSLLFQKILFKKSLGIGVSTVNKAFGDKFIERFKVLLAPNKIPDIVKDVTYPCYIQPKLDGFRCVYHPEKGLISRNGKVLPNKHLKAYFAKIFAIKGYVLDGEMYNHKIGFNAIQSALTSEDAPLPKGFKFTIFDAMPKEDWDNESCDMVYEDRLSLVRQLVTSSITDYKKVIDIPTDIANNPTEVKISYKTHLQNNYEGAMIRSIDGKYLWKRATINSGEILKLKTFKSVDAAIEDIYDGEGEFEGKAGGVIFNFNGNTVRCGSGFSHALREDMAKEPSKYIGRTVEIKYFEETEEGSLRHPIFTRFREDK